LADQLRAARRGSERETFPDGAYQQIPGAPPQPVFSNIDAFCTELKRAASGLPPRPLDREIRTTNGAGEEIWGSHALERVADMVRPPGATPRGQATTFGAASRVRGSSGTRKQERS